MIKCPVTSQPILRGGRGHVTGREEVAMLKWLLIGLVSLAVLAGAVVLVGLVLPRDHVASSSVVIRQPRDTVWLAVRDLAMVAEWWGDVEQVEPIADPQGREKWRHHLKSGFPMPLVVTEDEPAARLVTEIDAPDAPFGGTWTYEIRPADGGSRVTLTERGWIANPVFRFMAHTFFGLHGTMDSYLTALGRRFDEDVTPVHEP